MRINPILAVLALSIFGNGETAFAQQPQPPSAGRPVEPIPTLLTMNQKVAMANHIFIGTGKRVSRRGAICAGPGAGQIAAGV